MNVKDYQTIIKARGFNEFPLMISPHDDLLSSFLNYSDFDSELKIHLTKLILCRCFHGTYIAWYEDVLWFIKAFLVEYERDEIRPHLTEAIRDAMEMCISENKHSTAVIGTAFMYGILEFYAKHHLGFRPTDYNHADEKKEDYSRAYHPTGKKIRLTLASAFDLLQSQNLSIAAHLNEIDKFTKERLTEVDICESKEKGIFFKISDRLRHTRNPMLHGERHSPAHGPYMVMLYILFHLARNG